MTTKTNPRKDFVQVAHSVFQQASGEALPKEELKGKKADSRKGGLKGGKTRMAALSEDQRRELAKKAAEARWQKPAPTEQTGAGIVKSTKQD